MAKYSWLTGVNGSWTDDGNWSPNGTPGSADIASITAPGTYQINLDVSAVGSITLNSINATIDPSSAFTLGGVLDIKGGTFIVDTTINSGSILVDGGILIFDGGALQNVDVTVGSTSTLNLSGDVELYGQLTNEGTLNFSGRFPEVGEFYSKTTVINDGIYNISGNSDGASNLTNNGIVNLSNGAGVQIYQGENYGTIQLSSGAELTTSPLQGLNAGTVSFLDNSGTIYLSRGTYSNFTLAGFRPGDELNLPGFNAVKHVGNTLDVVDIYGGEDQFTLTGGDYTDASFSFTGVDLSMDAPCYCEGTRLLTVEGERNVESLRVGDILVTDQSGVRANLPIRWIGHRKIVVDRHPEPGRVAPVRVDHNAFAAGIPHSDLFLSPDHAIHVDGILVQARQLINGMTIHRDSSRHVFTYYHVELDRHAIVIANGLPCESYLETGNRSQFSNGGRVAALHPAFTRFDHELMCAPLVVDGTLIQPVWQRLTDRAGGLGHPMTTMPTTNAPDIHLVLADGTVVRPQNDMKDERYVFLLPPAATRLDDVRLRSRHAAPSDHRAWLDDRRQLGIAVAEIAVGIAGNNSAVRPLDSRALLGGWWNLEHDGDRSWRWTDGNAHLPLPQDCIRLELTVVATMDYLEDSDACSDLYVAQVR